MRGLLLIYQTDSIVDLATAPAELVEGDSTGDIKTQDITKVDTGN
jgi:hypothetical protein